MSAPSMLGARSPQEHEHEDEREHETQRLGLAAIGATLPDATNLIYIWLDPRSPPRLAAARYAVICGRPRDKHGMRAVAG